MQKVELKLLVCCCRRRRVVYFINSLSANGIRGESGKYVGRSDMMKILG